MEPTINTQSPTPAVVAFRAKNHRVGARVMFCDNPAAMLDWGVSKNAAAGNDASLITRQSNRVVHFHCARCNHDYSRIASDASHSTAAKPNCVYCVKNATRLCSRSGIAPGDDGHCAFCFKRSYAGYAATTAHPWTWSKTNAKAAHQVFARGRSVAHFDCNVCRHEFKSILGNITRNSSRKSSKPISACPFCDSRKACHDIQCIVCSVARMRFEKRDMVKEKRQFGKSCVCCNQHKALKVFSKVGRKWHMPNTCLDCCRIQDKTRREQVRDLEADATRMRTCKECGVDKIAGELQRMLLPPPEG